MIVISGYMYEHFKNIEVMYGNAYVQMPNGIFRNLLSIKSKNGSTNIKQSSFAYAYLVAVAFLYKYAHFVDIDNNTYIQNADIKQVLGYGKSTKTIDKIIKKDGILESMGLIQTTKDYPVQFIESNDIINNYTARDFITINMINSDYINYKSIKDVVKNKNYEIREPTFFFDCDGDVGTLYEYSNTHRITIKEFMRFVYDKTFNNIDFLMYSFFKSKCHGLKDNSKEIALYKIIANMGIGKDAFYSHLKNLKDKNLIEVNHKSFKMVGDKHDSSIEANEYIFKGVCD